ncbi:MAG: sugar transferase [Lachnospirales bacterium]
MKNFTTLTKFIEGIIYLVIFNFSYLFILYFNYGGKYSIENEDAVINSVVALSMACIVILVLNNVFSTARKSKEENIIIMFMCATFNMIATMMIAFLLRGFAFPRSIIFMGYIIQIILFIAVKLMVIQVISFLKRDKISLLICESDDKQEIMQKILNQNNNHDFIKFFSSPDNCSVRKLIKSVDKIYISDKINRELVDQLVNYAITKNAQVCIIPKTYEIVIKNAKLQFAEDLPFFKINEMELSSENRIIKRTFDICASFLGLVILSPVMLVVCLIILIMEGRPIIFKQKRVTHRNRIFTLYKFRTMVKDAEKNTGAIWAKKNDNRITPLGITLRRFWLDELPQLVNVLKGDMSMVGPRPERPELINKFTKDIPDFAYRVSVKAGVTGYAQVMGRYATTPDKKLKFDLIYIQNQSFWFDLTIILETVKKVILGTLKRSEKSELTYEEILIRDSLEEIKNKNYSTYKKVK